MQKYLVVFMKYKYLLYNLIERDIKVKYRRSVLGLFWSILNPLLTMMILTFVFSNLFKFQVENFALYVILGLTMFNFMSEATNLSMMSMLAAGPLIKKVYIPKYIFPLEKSLFAFVNLIFSMIAVILVVVYSGVNIKINVILFPIPLIYLLVFSTGLGFILSAMAVFFRDILHLYGVILTAWMYLTPIIYPISILPDFMKKLMLCNPMYHYIEYFRNIIMYGTIPGVRENLICIGFAIITLIAGLLIFKVKQDRFILFI
ncbi:MAG: ABC transporter permease [Eubacteriales bacterium]